eukprot:1079451-Rhodomonas_salina.2
MRIRGYLNEKSILEIFALRPRPSPITGVIPFDTAHCRALSSLYKISNKTVRDVWLRNSWAKVTEPFLEVPQSARIAEPAHNLPSRSDKGHPSSSDPTIDGAASVADVFMDVDAAVSTDSVDSPSNVSPSTAWLIEYIETLPRFDAKDPFHGDWLSTLTRIDLGTTVPPVTTTEKFVMHFAEDVKTTETFAESAWLEWNHDEHSHSDEPDAIDGGVGEEFDVVEVCGLMR